MGEDKTMSVGMILLVLIGGFFAYRMFHPATTFAADGIDAFDQGPIHSSSPR